MPRKNNQMLPKPDGFEVPLQFLEKLIPGPTDAAGVEAVFQHLKKAVVERALSAELGKHLEAAEITGNHRNGRTGKTLMTGQMVDGRSLKMLCVIDEYTRECLAMRSVRA